MLDQGTERKISGLYRDEKRPDLYSGNSRSAGFTQRQMGFLRM